MVGAATAVALSSVRRAERARAGPAADFEPLRLFPSFAPPSWSRTRRPFSESTPTRPERTTERTTERTKGAADGLVGPPARHATPPNTARTAGQRIVLTQCKESILPLLARGPRYPITQLGLTRSFSTCFCLLKLLNISIWQRNCVKSLATARPTQEERLGFPTAILLLCGVSVRLFNSFLLFKKMLRVKDI